MTPLEYLKNKKVLVMGLGLLGGGIATTKWLVKHSAKVTVTDLKDRKTLAGSIKALGKSADKIRFVLGRHLPSDFRLHDIVVVNPAVPKESNYLKIAREAGAELVNEATLFFNLCSNPIIAVTGTRGKTTTVNWIHHFLKQKFPKAVLAGNSPAHPFLQELGNLDGKSPVVIEISSWHLELFDEKVKPPHIAVITNLYPDHLNRHVDMNDYASAKANIFKHQTQKDFLILNKKNDWTKFYLNLKPKSKILYADNVEKYLSERFLGEDINVSKNKRLTVEERKDIFLKFAKVFGDHNLQNLKTAVLVANLAGVDWNLIKKTIKTLPQIKFRQEVIYQDKNLTVVNDTTATSPDATISALNRFSYRGEASIRLILITGGTSKNLEFDAWAKVVKKTVKPEDIFLLEGSATIKMLDSLNKINFFKKTSPQIYLEFNTLLTSALKYARLIKGKKILLFSPSAASFEKFKNEFDRGEQFNQFFNI